MGLILTLVLQLMRMNFSLSTVFPNSGLLRKEQGLISVLHINFILFCKIVIKYNRSDIEEKKQELRLMVGYVTLLLSRIVLHI
jgi:hypothetical protein